MNQKYNKKKDNNKTKQELNNKLKALERKNIIKKKQNMLKN